MGKQIRMEGREKRQKHLIQKTPGKHRCHHQQPSRKTAKPRAKSTTGREQTKAQYGGNRSHQKRHHRSRLRRSQLEQNTQRCLQRRCHLSIHLLRSNGRHLSIPIKIRSNHIPQNDRLSNSSCGNSSITTKSIITWEQKKTDYPKNAT